MILPVFKAIHYSLRYFNVLEAPVFVGMDNYIRLFFEDDLFLKALKNTLVIAVITGPLSYLMCLIIAWMLNELRSIPRAIMTLFFYAPAISNVYYIWSIIFSGDSYGIT